MKYITIIIFSLLLCVCTTTKTKEAPFSVDLDSPKIPIGKFDAQFDPYLNVGSMRTVNITVNYYPLEDAVCLQYRLDFLTLYQFWEIEPRAAYLAALEQYKNDFDQRNLSEKGSRKTKRQYGKVDCFLIWQASSFTVRANGNTFIELGYDMKKVSNNKVAFFTLYQLEAEFIRDKSVGRATKSPNIPMYLTRSQADELAGFFDQDLLKSLRPAPTEKKVGSSIFDTY